MKHFTLKLAYTNLSSVFSMKNNCSTDYAIIQLIKEFSKSFDKNDFTLDSFIDLSKAFDTVTIL